MGPIGEEGSVAPSGRARTTWLAAMVPAAPVMLLTTTGWPRAGWNSAASRRATMSAAEPAPKAVTMVTVAPAGCARAVVPVGAEDAASSKPAARAMWRLVSRLLRGLRSLRRGRRAKRKLEGGSGGGSAGEPSPWRGRRSRKGANNRPEGAASPSAPVSQPGLRATIIR